MTNEEMVILIQQGYDLMGELYLQNKRFIYKCVKPFQNIINDVDDLMQIAYFGLDKAVKEYKPELGFKFLTSARWHIINSVRRAVNKQSGIPDNVFTLIQQYKRLLDKLSAYNGKRPSDEQISLAMGINITRLAEIKKYMCSIKSLDEYLFDDKDITLSDTIADDTLPDMDEIAEKKDLKRILWAEIDKLQDNYRDVIIKRYKENKTYTDISKDYGITKQTVTQIESKALRQIRGNSNIRRIIHDYLMC